MKPINALKHLFHDLNGEVKMLLQANDVNKASQKVEGLCNAIENILLLNGSNTDLDCQNDPQAQRRDDAEEKVRNPMDLSSVQVDFNLRTEDE